MVEIMPKRTEPWRSDESISPEIIGTKLRLRTRLGNSYRARLLWLPVSSVAIELKFTRESDEFTLGARTFLDTIVL